MSPTQRSLAHLRKAGAMAAIVERWNPHAKVRQDLFGFIDLVAVGDWPGVMAVQTTSGDHVAHRLAKMRDKAVAERARRWLAAGNALVIHGWRKAGARGKRKLWALREVVVTAEDLIHP